MSDHTIIIIIIRVTIIAQAKKRTHKIFIKSGYLQPATRRRLLFSKTTSHVFPAVSKQSYTDHYLVAIAMLRRQSLWLAENYYH